MERRMVYVRASEAQEAEERARLRAVEAERNYADDAREYSAAMADLGYDPRVGAVLDELHNRLVGGPSVPFGWPGLGGGQDRASGAL
jgi:hypothetical protein